VNALVVVESVRRWPLDLPGVEVVSARSYLTDPRFSTLRGAAVYNMCRKYGYQSIGYYVSLLAAARGHRPLPSVSTLQDVRLAPLIRIVSEGLDELIQSSLSPLKSLSFELSIYFGRNVARRYDRLSRALFNQFPAPFLRASFSFDGYWRLEGIRPIATSEIPESHRPFVIQQATQFFSRPGRSRRRKQLRYDMAILWDPADPEPPSDDRAIRRFIRAARAMGINATRILADDYGRIAEFDALFIRETTSVNHRTYRFSRRAAAEGLVVIDDPESIVRCTNKVYQAELFARHGIPTPETMVVTKDNIDEVGTRIGLPCILKRPDSSFSQGVVKATDTETLRTSLVSFLEESDLVIAQEYTPSAFDWRIGILDGRALYACKYYMASGHWQIIGQDRKGGRRYGKVEAFALPDVPPRARRLAERSANLIGDGLYGVDIKEIGGRFVVMEVNDNPSIDAGYEDGIIGDELYLAIMRLFRERLDARGSSGSRT